MIIVRLLLLVVFLGVGGSLVAWLLTGRPVYRRWAWRFFCLACIMLSLLLGLLAIERLFF